MVIVVLDNFVFINERLTYAIVTTNIVWVYKFMTYITLRSYWEVTKTIHI